MSTEGLERETVDGSPDAGERETASVESAPAEPEEPPLDVVFGVLKNRRRRLVLRYLHEETATTTLSDLAEYIAALENDKEVAALSSEERKRVYVCLYQSHLPKMDDVGVIEFESDRGTVELADDTEAFTRYLSFSSEPDARPWPRYYLALSAAGGAVFLAQWLAFPSTLLSSVIIGVLVGLVANLALEHAYKRGLLEPGAVRSVADPG